MRRAKPACLATSADAPLPRRVVFHDDGGAVDDGGHPGATDEVDVEVRANLVSASASYSLFVGVLVVFFYSVG